MQVIYGPGNASNVLLTAQKRLIRPAYAQTQGFPYAAYLDPSLRNADGSLRVPQSGDTAGVTATGAAAPSPLTYSHNVFTYENSIVPGTVMVKSSGENASVANGAANIQPWGLLDQWIGGAFDNIGQINEIGIWMGPDSTYDLLAPAWNDAGLPGLIASSGAGTQVLLYAGTDGRLGVISGTSGAPATAAAAGSVPVARVIQRWSAARLTIQLVI
jgi:hypothetical protein